MSDESFSVNTDGLAAQMPYMQELAQRFRSVHEELESRLGALGECWGDDATGEQFVNQYAKPRGQILEATGDAADVLTSTGDGIRTMARGLEGIESQNADASRRLGGSLAPGATPSGGTDGGPKETGRP